MDSKLARLSIGKDAIKSKPARLDKDGRGTVADSWEDEATASDSELDLNETTSRKKSTMPNAPPPTPASPTSAIPPWGAQAPSGINTRLGNLDSEERRRPEKSTAAAGRLIAAGLGMRAPKKSDEQKAYDKAMGENEIKRKNREKEARDREQKEKEKAHTAIWES